MKTSKVISVIALIIAVITAGFLIIENLHTNELKKMQACPINMMLDQNSQCVPATKATTQVMPSILPSGEHHTTYIIRYWEKDRVHYTDFSFQEKIDSIRLLNPSLVIMKVATKDSIILINFANSKRKLFSRDASGRKTLAKFMIEHNIH